MDSVKYFDSIAYEWDELRKKYFEDEIRKRAIELSELNTSEDLIVADVGTGSGFMALEASKYAKAVIGIDVSTEMLRCAKRNVENLKLDNVFFIKGSMEQLPVIDFSFDVVFTNMALHHVENPFKGIMEMYRILKPGGILIITDVMKHNGEWARFEMYDKWLGFEIDDVENWMKKCKFKEIDVKHSGLYAQAKSSKGEFIKTGIFIAKGIK